MKRSLALFLALLFLLTPLACAAKPAPITLLSEHGGGTVEINDEVVRGYLALPIENSLPYLKENCYKATSAAHDSQGVLFSWEGGEAPYTVTVGTDAALTDAQTWETNKTKLEIGVFLPETDYWWKVTDAGGGASETGAFRTGAGVRLITTRKTVKANGVQNVRDLGGKRAAGGKTIRYGMLYRGGLLEYHGSVYSQNVADEYGLDALNRLGIRTELDLRNDADVGGQTESPLTACGYARHTFTGYDSIFPDTPYFDARTPDSLREIFALLAREESYPVYFHCLIGQDRTGTLAYLILGLLGVSYDDILRDYELTAFSLVGSMHREAPFTFSGEATVKEPAAFEALHARMLEYGNGDLQSAIRAYLSAECGVPEAQLDRIAEILLTDAK